MGPRRFVGLTMTAHGVSGDALLEQNGPGDCLPRYRSGICKHGFAVGRQRHGADAGIDHGDAVGQVLVVGQQGYRQGAVRDEDPDHGRHDLADFVPAVDPNSVLVTGPKGAFPRLIVERVLIKFCGSVHRWSGTYKAVDGGTAFG